MGSLADLYALEEELGRGGMGVVYRARERLTGRDVALKLLLPGVLDPEQLLRSRREGELLAALRHPGIVAVHAAGEEGGRPWLATELVAGARALDRAWVGLDRGARVALVRDVARALGHAHARGIVHRDVKAANVLVGADGAARVVDFGLALGHDAERLTETGTLLGTPYAMAPEQVEAARGAVGPATDVWALGVLLHEALTGARPFTGKTPMELGVKILTSEPTPPRALDPTISPALEAVVVRALRRPPAERFADGAAFAAALEAAARRPEAAPGGRPPAAPALLLLGLVVALVAAIGLAGRPASSIEAAPVVTGAALDDASARARYGALREGEDRSRQVERWLVDFPGHPLAQEVRTLAPRLVVPTRRPAHALFLSASAFVVVDEAPLGGGTILERWLLGPDGGLAGREELHRLGGRVVGRPAYDPKRRHLAVPLRTGVEETAPGFVVVVFDLSTRIPVLLDRIPTEIEPRAVRWTARNGLVAIFAPQPAVFCLADGASTLLAHDGDEVYSVCEVGALLVTGSGDRDDGTGVLSARRGPELVWSLRPPEVPDVIAASPGGALLALGTRGGQVLLFSPERAKEAPREAALAGWASVAGVPGALLLAGEGVPERGGPRRAHAGRIVGLAFTPDGRRLVSVGAEPAPGPSAGASDLRVWDVVTGRERVPARRLDASGDALGTFDLAPDGRHALAPTVRRGARGDEHFVEVWQVE